MHSKKNSTMNNKQSNLSTDFSNQTHKAINLLSEHEGLHDDKEAIKLLIDNNIEEIEAREIITFLPIAFIRHWLSSIKWSDSYGEAIDGNEIVKKKYSETESYLIIEEVTSNYFKHTPKKETIFKIAGRSAEFNAINHLLLNNPKNKIEDIQLSDRIIIR